MVVYIYPKNSAQSLTLSLHPEASTIRFVSLHIYLVCHKVNDILDNGDKSVSCVCGEAKPNEPEPKAKGVWAYVTDADLTRLKSLFPDDIIDYADHLALLASCAPGDRCNLKDCLDCKDIWAAIHFDDIFPKIRMWRNVNQLTLTIPSTPDLAGQVSAMNDYYSRLIRSTLFTNYVNAGVCGTGLTHNLDAGHHYHFHVLLELFGITTQEFRPQVELKWEHLTGIHNISGYSPCKIDGYTDNDVEIIKKLILKLLLGSKTDEGNDLERLVPQFEQDPVFHWEVYQVLADDKRIRWLRRRREDYDK